MHCNLSDDKMHASYIKPCINKKKKKLVSLAQWHTAIFRFSFTKLKWLVEVDIKLKFF